MLEYNKGKCADKAERSRVMVIRTQYLERLRPFYDSELVKVITGIRRCGKSTILRQVIAEIKENGIGLFNWFMNNKHEVLGYTKSIWGGVTTLELAKFIEYISNVNMTGLLHLSNGEQITKCDLLKLFNNYFKDNQIKIIETDGLIENRSIYTIRDYCSFYVSSYKQMIYEMSVWMDNHKMLYKHYIRR